jgi:branched-chain amino acid transport system permease protein
VLLTGVGGMTSFGQAAFVGVGAYTSAVLTTHYGLSPWLGLLAGLALTLVIATALGLLTCAWPATTCRWAPSPGASACISCSATCLPGRLRRPAKPAAISLFGWQIRDSADFTC